MKTEDFREEIYLGDAGLPCDIDITVWYTEENDIITVHDSEDRGGPENLPNWWSDKIGQLIQDHFLKKVIFI